MDFYRSKLWIRIMLPITFVIAILMAAIILVNIRSEYTLLDDQLRNQNTMLAKAVKGGMEDALAIGNNDVVRDQFKKLKIELPNVQVHIYDFKQRISFSTEKYVGKNHSEIIEDQLFSKALESMLNTGDDNRETYRVNFSDKRYNASIYPIMNEKRCYHCHGSSKKVLGGMTVISLTEKALTEIEKTTQRNVIIGLITLFSVVLMIFLLIKFNVNNRVARILNIMDKLSKGDFTNNLTFRGSDELCQIADRMNMVSCDLSGILKRILENADGINRYSGILSSLASDFSKNSHEASDNAASVSAAAEQMSTNMNTIAAASEQASSNLSLIAASAEEMNSTVNEIAANSNSAKEIIHKAVNEVGEVSSIMDELNAAAIEIDSVTGVIQSIAEQVTLLALNAKIEAARAGDAGKGFAVVAQEITGLSVQTSTAVEEAEKKIKWIQERAKQTAEKVSAIAKVIEESDDSITSIATAAEEQSISSKEIAQNVSQASVGISGVNENVAQSAQVAGVVAKQITEIDSITSSIDKGSLEVDKNAKDLSQMAEELEKMLKSFKI